MKIISLNTHSWLEENPLEKLKETADFIINQGADIIALQEINQRMDEQEVVTSASFCSVSQQQPIKADNYALLLVNYLKEKGYTYYWGWTYSHIGYDIYEEGSAILSLKPFKAESILVSPMDDPTDYHTRQLLLANIEELQLTVGSCHFSWWTDDKKNGFYYEWQQVLKKLETNRDQVVLLGDFNAPAHLRGQGYDLVRENFEDVYELAIETEGSYTVNEEIDGWEDNEEKLRIDFGFIKKKVEVNSYRVIFNEQNGPVVSDHFGIMVDM